MNDSKPITDDLTRIIQLLGVAEKLKSELRHSWLSSGRRESVAEHSWRMALMVILLHRHLDQPVDVEKCLKMAILHDLPEAEVGDIPTFEAQLADAKAQKFQNEQQAALNLREMVGGAVGAELYEVWHEYELQESYEARFVRALDKIEVQLQHNEADLSTWLPLEHLMLFQPKWMSQYCDFDSGLSAMSDLVIEQGLTKLQADGHNVDALREEALAE
jgi:putative hydrolases of HD superfamily